MGRRLPRAEPVVRWMRIQSHDHCFPPNVDPLYIGGFRDDWDMGVEMHTISGMTGRSAHLNGMIEMFAEGGFDQPIYDKEVRQ